MFRRLFRLALLVLLPALLVVPMAAPGAGAQSATAVAAPTTALDWTPCGDDAPGWECAELPVPIDYAEPDGDAIDMAVTRLPAGDPARRIGVLVFNCGGPGCPAVSFLHEAGALLFPEETLARFDLVGFDPRGTGASAAVTCGVDWDAYLALDPSPDDEAEREAWLAGGRAYAESCAANGGALLPHMETERNAPCASTSSGAHWSIGGTRRCGSGPPAVAHVVHCDHLHATRHSRLWPPATPPEPEHPSPRR